MERLSRRARAISTGVVLSLSLALPVVFSAPAQADLKDAQPGAASRGDFNGDGFADLAIGAMGANGTIGAVNVIYGSKRGLDPAGPVANQLLVRDDIPGEPIDQFGITLAVGDFNGDGYGDLAVGVPGAEAQPLQFFWPGGVNVFYGSPHGLTTPSQKLSPPLPQQDGEHFGAALAAGDFNGDGKTDLAVDAPDKDVGAAIKAGQVTVFAGSASGLIPTNVVLDEEHPGLHGPAENYEGFGLPLAAGDVNGDGRADLAVGVPDKTVNGIASAGAVHVFSGVKCVAPCQLLNPVDQFLYQGAPGVKDVPEVGDHFGTSLAMGDFGRGRQTDLAVGVPDQRVGTAVNAGTVQVFYGSPSGLATNGTDQVFSQDSPGVKGTGQAGARFGLSLAAGNLGKGRQADLAIGIEREDVGTNVDAGAVEVLYGRSSGLSVSGDSFITQDTKGISGVAEAGARFGSSLAIAGFGKGDVGALAVSAPRASVGTVPLAGAVHVIQGDSDDGVRTGRPDQLIVQGTATDPIQGESVTDGYFGFGYVGTGVAG